VRGTFGHFHALNTPLDKRKASTCYRNDPTARDFTDRARENYKSSSSVPQL
jgi:hypothetical protein